MKKLLLLAGLCLSQFLYAQTSLSNPGLESWTTVFGSSAEEPNGWLTANTATSSLLTSPNPNTNPVSVTKVTDATEGTYAMRLETVTLNYNPDPNYIPNTGGVAFIGTMEVFFTTPMSVKLHSGFPVSSFVPTAFSFDAKYAPVNSDVGLVSVYLTHWNGTSADTIAEAIQTFSSAVATYTPYTINVTYDPAFTGVSADTCMVAFASSDPNGAPENGSVLYADNLAFTLPAGIRAPLSEDGVMVYPNPAKDKLNIQGLNQQQYTAVKVLTLDGREVLYTPLSVQNFSTESLKDGLYLLQIFNKENQLVSTKRFSVKR